MQDDNQYKKIKLEKLEKIRELGWNPYAASYDKKNTIKEASESDLGKVVKTAGRLYSFREHGNIAFADLKDETGSVQVFFQKKLLGDDFKNVKLLDIGDFIGVEGEIVKTIAGEISIAPTSYTLLTKSIATLPSEWFGVKDVETRFRQRYLDLLLNPEVRERFNIRTKIVSGTREYLDSVGFWEVETPTLQPLYGGANARPFKTHVNAFGQEMYLRIADELYLKRLIVGGYEKVYEIAKDFRNEGIDHTHFPEFTMIEWYEAYADYHRVMDVAEGLIKHLAKKIYGTTVIKVGDRDIDVGKKWPRIEMSQILLDKLGLDVEKESAETLLKYAKENCHDAQIVGGETKGQLIYLIFEHLIPQTLDEPTYIIDYPEDVSPLSKNHRNKPGWVERFEAYIGGKEIYDGWSELTDPVIQRERLTKDSSAARVNKDEAQHVDEDFLAAMEFGMPPFGGIGVGIDRLTMFLTNTWAIKEVVIFPTLKPATKVENKKEVKVKVFNNPNIFFIDKAISEKFASVSCGVAIIRGVSIEKGNDQLDGEIKEAVSSLRNMTNDDISASPEILSYRKLYKETGIDWHSRRPSPEALLRRIIAKKDLYKVNTCVDAYNLVVIKNKISVGAFDLDKIEFPTALRFSTDQDKIHLLGDESEVYYKNGEIAYFDQIGGINMDFNYRDSVRTAVQLDTKNLYINVDGVYDVTPEKVAQVLQETCDIIVKYCGGKVEEFGVVRAS
ncbi:MAG TPA: lysine--tRNA ligase [Patescibacteria group bacterium]|nr:lysine--tRNA ligase [Patescibacteria group bacterium]